MTAMDRTALDYSSRSEPGNNGFVPNANGSAAARDLELNPVASVSLLNDLVHTFEWHNINVTVKDQIAKGYLPILTGANGLVEAGEMVAIMGPSGSGKTTLLNTLAHRLAAAGATMHGDILVNGQCTKWENLRNLSASVEQEDALIGSLTVHESMNFAARLALPRYFSSPAPLINMRDLTLPELYL